MRKEQNTKDEGANLVHEILNLNHNIREMVLKRLTPIADALQS